MPHRFPIVWRGYFSDKQNAGIRVNEIRFIAEDAGFSEARVAATLTAKTLGADADMIQDWFRSPEKMIQLIAAAEGSHGKGGGREAGGRDGHGQWTWQGAGSGPERCGNGGREAAVGTGRSRIGRVQSSVAPVREPAAEQRDSPAESASCRRPNCRAC